MQQQADWLTPAAQMPWPVSTPFRMRPNLEKLDPEAPALLLRDEQFEAYRRLRQAVFASHAERACVGTANGDTVTAIANLIPSPLAGEGARRAGQAEGEGRNEVAVATEGSNERKLTEGVGSAEIFVLETSPSPPPLSPQGRGEQRNAQSVALRLQEDFVILKNENETLRTEYLSVCFPSRWDPREKLGLDFAAIHAPVADNQMLLAAGPSIMTMAFMKQPMLRHVWLIVPSSSLDQHPEQNDYSWSETLKDPSPLLPRLFFRVERQTTWPLPQFSRAVFFIRVMMAPLTQVLAQAPERAHELREALASMTAAVVEYRGMMAALPRLLAELADL